MRNGLTFSRPMTPCRVCGCIVRYVQTGNCLDCAKTRRKYESGVAKEKREVVALDDGFLKGHKVRPWMWPLTRDQMNQVMRGVKYEDVVFVQAQIAKGVSEWV